MELWRMIFVAKFWEFFETGKSLNGKSVTKFRIQLGKIHLFQDYDDKMFLPAKKFLLNVLRHPRPILRVLFFLWLELMIEQENLWRKIFPTESLENPNNIHCFQEHNEAGKKTVKNISWEIFSKNSRKSPFPRIAWKRKNNWRNIVWQIFQNRATKFFSWKHLFGQNVKKIDDTSWDKISTNIVCTNMMKQKNTLKKFFVTEFPQKTRAKSLCLRTWEHRYVFEEISRISRLPWEKTSFSKNLSNIVLTTFLETHGKKDWCGKSVEEKCSFF